MGLLVVGGGDGDVVAGVGTAVEAVGVTDGFAESLVAAGDVAFAGAPAVA